MKIDPPLYPLKFIPLLKEKIWGGIKLAQNFNKHSDGVIGESWEVSGVEGSVSVVQNGDLLGKTINELLEEFKEKLVGEKVYATFGNKFPLLFKFIDANKNLSVQLHPNDALANKRHNSFGKTEMWYILVAEEDARLILGFNQEMNKKKYLQYLSENRIAEILHTEKIKAGDSFFIAPGTVHAIGAGVMLAEIQQTSDITYRIHDWNRRGLDGELRELHTDLALQAINFDPTETKINYIDQLNNPIPICDTPYFKVCKLILTGDYKKDNSNIDSFIVYMCVDGSVIFKTKEFSESIEKGETILIPASENKLKIITESATLLEVYIP